MAAFWTRCAPRKGISSLASSSCTSFCNAKGIKRYQVVQRSLEKFEVSLVPDSDFDPSVLDLLRRELAKAVGDSVELDFRFVEDIPLTPTGKLRVTVSELA